VRLIIILILFSSKLYSQDIKYKTYFLDKEVKIIDNEKQNLEVLTPYKN